MTVQATKLDECTNAQDVCSRRPSEAMFNELVERTWKKAYWTAFDILGDAAEAEDLCQEALLRAYERWEEFRHQSSADTWVYRIVVNLCLNHRRRKGIWFKISQALQHQAKNVSSWDAHPSFLNPEQRLRSRETVEAVHRAMQHLSTQQRTVFSLRYLQGFTTQEIAELSDMALGTVKSHMFRAIKAMKKILTEQEFEHLLQ